MGCHWNGVNYFVKTDLISRTNEIDVVGVKYVEETGELSCTNELFMS